MSKANAVLVLVILGGIGLAVTVFELIGRQRGTSPIGTVIRTALSSERIVTPVEKKEAPRPEPKSEPRKRPASDPKTSKPAPPIRQAPVERVAAPVASPPAITVAAAPAESRPPAALAVGVAHRRQETFVAGNRAEWSSFDIFVDKPTTIRAGGAVRAGNALSGPGGVAPPANGYGTRAARALPNAPHLALIGRICSTDTCSPPFLVGARTVLCPSMFGLTGDLQLWINNYVQLDGYQTLAHYSDVAGGYRFEVEPASDAACSEPESAPTPPVIPAEALARGEVLKSQSFSVSSRQNAWKPFFLPMDRPLLVRARGEMQPYERTKPTGPDGIVVPDVTSWTYPGTKAVVIDSEHPLVVPSLPYQSLIGRLCSASGCGEPFFIGSERTICPDARFNERLELWINHIIARSGDLQVPFADLTFQGRRGEYRFDVSNAPAGACGSHD